nr:hypothetical protein [Pseudodesulfovibrio sp.]
MMTEEWLKNINNEFCKKDIAYKQRPFMALSKFSIENNNMIIKLNSDVAQKVFNWFKENAKKNIYNIGSLYSSTYFYDGEFWEVEIPNFYGKVQLNPLESLKDMPILIKNRLLADFVKVDEYKKHWKNCLDFALNYNAVKVSENINEYGLQLFKAAYEEITSASILLNEKRTNPRALFNSRLAVEIFLKSYLAIDKNFIEKNAIEIGHDLKKGLKKVIKKSNFQSFKDLENQLNIFPNFIKERYKPQIDDKRILWKAFSLTQHIGALVAYEFSREII